MSSALAVCLLVVAVARSSFGVDTQVGKFIPVIQDVKMASENNDKVVQQLQLELQAKSEENKQILLKFQEMENNLTTALQQVKELGAEEELINATVERLSQENVDLKSQIADRDAQVLELSRKLNESLLKLALFSDSELHLNNILDEYYRDKDWRALRRNLESFLDKESTAYEQLQRIPYGLGYPIWKIGSSCYITLAEVLLSGSQGPNISESDGDTMLHGAAEGGCEQLVNILLDHNADIETKDNGGATPLIIASRYGRLPMVRLLAQRGADVNMTDNTGMTGMHLAAEGGHLDVVKYLVDVGAELSPKNNDGYTPLAKAKSRGRFNVVEYLSPLVHEDLEATTRPPRRPDNFHFPHRTMIMRPPPLHRILTTASAKK